MQGSHNELKVEANEPDKVRQTSFSATGAEQTSHSRMAGRLADVLHSHDIQQVKTMTVVTQHQKCATPKDNHQVRPD